MNWLLNKMVSSHSCLHCGQPVTLGWKRVCDPCYEIAMKICLEEHRGSVTNVINEWKEEIVKEGARL